MTWSWSRCLEKIERLAVSRHGATAVGSVTIIRRHADTLARYPPTTRTTAMDSRQLALEAAQKGLGL